jgi:hypothetical protein
LAALFVVTLTLLGAPNADPGGVEFFEKKIRPVLVRECYSCHSAEAKELKGSLRLDSRAAIRQGGTTAPAVVPGSVSESLLIAAIRRDGPKMPPDKALPASVVADFVRWIELGAPDPRDEAPTFLALEERRRWWSLQPVAQAEVPEVTAPERASDPIDRFVLRRLDEAGLQPAPVADDHALLRRLSFVLRGLPPSREEIDAFHAASSPDKYERLVDRLLASPSFGERWARHWMDVISFSETQGHEWNPEVRGSWRYRDYLIRAFNEDVPYDQLIREHLCGDLLTQPRWDPVEDINESVAGTAFLRFGEIDHDDCRLFPANYLDPIEHQIDTISKGFQATTVACARCHDHKFDGVSMRDYYALSGVLSNARHVVHTLDRPSLHDDRKQELTALKRKIRQEIVSLWLKELVDLERYVHAALARATEDAEADVLAKGLDAERLKSWIETIQPGATKADGKKAPPKKSREVETQALESIVGPLRWLVDRLTKTTTGTSAVGAAESPAVPPQDLPELWQELGSRFGKENTERRSFNEEKFTTYEDFRAATATSWTRSGFALEDKPSPSGDFVVATAGERVIAQVLQAGVHSHALSNRLNASFRSPLIPKAGKYISVEVAGEGGAMRQVYENCSVWNGASVRLRSNEFRWVRVNTQAEEPDLTLILELVTRFDDYGYPGIFAKKFADPEDIRSHFSLRRIVFHDEKESPKKDISHLDPLFDSRSPTSLATVAQLYSGALATAVNAWSRNEATDADSLWLDWAVQSQLLTHRPNATPRLRDWIRKYREIEGDIRPPRVIAGVADFEKGFDVRLRIAGEAHRPGDFVPRGYLQILTSAAPTPSSPPQNSGRLELAAAIASAENPLTARVMVNRIWHHVFGSGLVRTTDDFGHLGELPSHPELLDHLADRFVAAGWSIKGLVRALVLTQSFRMASRVDAQAREVDPENRRLHHYPLRRLEGEAIRDAMLAVSGRLDQELFGHSIDPHRTEERPVRKLLSGPLDGRGRRSIYTRFTLTEEPPFLATFNLPDPKHPRGRRDVTNVPTQALTLLNNPFVLAQAELWAQRLTKETVDDNGDAAVADRIDRMFHVALGRPADAADVARFSAGARRIAEIHDVAAEELLTSEAVWKDMAHLLFNVKEFIYLR